VTPLIAPCPTECSGNLRGKLKRPDKIVTQFKSVKLHHHWPCTVCGGHTGAVNVLNEAPDGAALVCEHCLKDGRIDERLETQARETRLLVGRLKVPTYEEWLAEEQRVDATRIAEGEEPSIMAWPSSIRRLPPLASLSA
jgi:transcription elongation factor Elf1